MVPKYETPAVKAGASRDFLGGPSRVSLTLFAALAQILILAFLIFGGAA